ncbi:MAG: hypothetical protein RMK32_04905 [Anaerolineae bacterium]|nr:hypothetical protein [Thermoflexus sp.]MDW8064951.1 hypothetical protein [Anaerolineae bacterium]
MNPKDETMLPYELQMLGPALMVLGVMLPWGASPEAQGLDHWGLIALLAGIPALFMPWAARETIVAHRILAALALITATAALGGWIAAWQAIPVDVLNPVTRIGKGPLFTLAGAVLTWATLPGPLKSWHRALAAGGGFGLMLAIVLGISAWLSMQKEAAAAMGSTAAPPMGTPWIIIQVHSPTEKPSRSTLTPTPPLSSERANSHDGFSPQKLATATPSEAGLELPALTRVPSPIRETKSPTPTPTPTATTPPLDPASPSPTAPPSPLNP